MTVNEQISEVQQEIGFQIKEIKTLRQRYGNESELDEDELASYFLSLEFRTKEQNTYHPKKSVAFYTLTSDGIESLVLINTQLRSIPKMIANIPSLKRLVLNSNRIRLVGDDLKNLTKLEFLDLSNNNISEWPKEINVRTLRALDLSYNSISNIPGDLGGLDMLTALFLSGNEIKTVPEQIIELTDLWKAHDTLLKVRNGKNSAAKAQKYEEAAQLRDQEKKLYAGYLCGLFVYNNPIANLPPELIARGSNSIKEYWKSLSDNPQKPLNEVKIMLVGEGGCGKTSLLRRLTKNEFDDHESQTHGINIKEWSLSNNNSKVKARIWDFGGQEIMHSTHQFFLSKRSIYLVMVDSRKDERIEYWLKHVESFGGDSPVLIVINKVDENPGYDLNRRFLQTKYKNIVGFFRTSCKKGDGITMLKEGITKALTQVAHLNTLWRREWFQVKDALEATNTNYISYSKFIKICVDNKVTNGHEQRELLSFLSDLGIMLNYREISLQDTNVLNPTWITSAVYKLLNSQEVASSNGVLSFSILSSLLDEKTYPKEKHNYIISLMKKFELCYDLSESQVLLPDLLGIEEDTTRIHPTIRFFIQYSFLPKSIMPRFIVRMHRNIDGKKNWRTGVVLVDQKYSSIAIVKSDDEERRISVEVEGVQARDFFSVIRSCIDDINQSFEKLSFEERVLIPNSEASVSYNHLLRLEAMSVDEYVPEGYSGSISVSEVLGTVHKTEKEKFEERIMAHLIFLKEKFNDHETVLSEANKIIELKPNIAGVGININALVDKLFGRKK